MGLVLNQRVKWELYLHIYGIAYAKTFWWFYCWEETSFKCYNLLYDSIRVRIEYYITETPTINKCVLKYAMNKFFTPYFRLMSVCRPSASLIFKSLNIF